MTDNAAGARMDYQDDIASRYVDSPGMEYAQWQAEAARGGITKAGKIEVQVRLSTIMGGFVKFRGTEAQQRACSIVKSTWERAVVGGSRAIDPSVEPVDGGYRNPEAVFEQGVDARALKSRIEAELGIDDTSRLVQVVVAGRGPTAYAKWRYRTMNKPNQRHISAGMSEVRGIADRVAVLLKLQGRVA